MKTRILGLTLATTVLLSQTCFGQARAKGPLGAWIDSDLDWQASEFHKDKSWTVAKVLFFYEDGRFGMIDGTIIRTAREMVVSDGDSQTVYFGTWKRTESQVIVTYRLIYRDIQPLGGEKQNADQQDHFVVKGDGVILFHGRTFRKEPLLDQSAAFTISEKLPRGTP
jgi:hypothetical protein